MTTIADLVDIAYADAPVSDGSDSDAAFWNTDILLALKTSVNLLNDVVTDEIGTDTTAATLRYRVTTNETNITTLQGYTNQNVKTTGSPTFQTAYLNLVAADNANAVATVGYVTAAVAGGAGKATQAEVSTGTNDTKYVTPYAVAVLAQLAGADFTGDVSIANGKSLAVDTIGQKTTATGVTIESMLVEGTVVTGLTALTSTALTGTLQTAAQTNITSLGTLTALQVDNININLNTISATSGAINITPATGSAVVIDNGASFDGTVLTGLTALTSTAITGTLQTAAQTNITTVGTLAGLTITGSFDGGTVDGGASDSVYT